jgi:adhesin HecA-like repeat protein
MADERAATSAIELAGRHRIDIFRGESGDTVELVAGDGKLVLAIEIGADGPVLRFDGPSLTIRSGGALTVEAQRLALRGEHGLTLSTGGDLEISAAGDLRTTGRTQQINAELGDVRIDANDDVRLDGERVLVNCT